MPSVVHAAAKPGKAQTPDHVSIWRCPRCRGAIQERADVLECRDCAHVYEQVDGIPDFRVPGDSWIDFAEDMAFARELAATTLPLKEW